VYKSNESVEVGENEMSLKCLKDGPYILFEFKRAFEQLRGVAMVHDDL
jgi:hypothetical protein